MRCSGHWTSED